jgi:3-oxoacyl-(acyl-carrier-protein) synthase
MSAAPSPLNDWPDDPKGPILALERALRSAGIKAKDVQFISASANGGKRLDRLEALALDRVFSTNKPFISSLKGAIGESLSSGGMRAAALLLSMERGAIPKTLGLLDPIMPLNFVMNENRDVKIENALLNGFSSGGTFISVVLRKS